ncbi:MAG: hypothetical protein LIP03_01670 [Bacteroidales bacterium]|nr:hypothetical protein [Bacteroidales bacterium]
MQRQIYKDVEDNLEDYAYYFDRIGFRLELGDGYLYFSRKETKIQLSEKLNRFSHWLDIIDLLKAWEPVFGPGFTFTKAQLLVKMDTDIELRDKAKALYEKKDRYSDVVDKMLDEMAKMGYIEKTDDNTERYTVVNAYRYLEELISMISIDNENEISE